MRGIPHVQELGYQYCESDDDADAMRMIAKIRGRGTVNLMSKGGSCELSSLLPTAGCLELTVGQNHLKPRVAKDMGGLLEMKREIFLLS